MLLKWGADYAEGEGKCAYRNFPPGGKYAGGGGGGEYAVTQVESCETLKKMVSSNIYMKRRKMTMKMMENRKRRSYKD